MKRLVFAVASIALGLGSVSCSSSAKKAGAPEPQATASAPAASAKTAKAAEASVGFSCANGTDQRKAEIKKQGSGCEVEYTKEGKTKAIASSASGTQHCQDVVAKIQKNLLAAGYKCQ